VRRACRVGSVRDRFGRDVDAPEIGARRHVSPEIEERLPIAGTEQRRLLRLEPLRRRGNLDADPVAQRLPLQPRGVEGPELAADLARSMDEGALPENSYAVALDANGELVRTTETDGQIVTTAEEPGTSFGRRFMIDLINFLPVGTCSEPVPRQSQGGSTIAPLSRAPGSPRSGGVRPPAGKPGRPAPVRAAARAGTRRARAHRGPHRR